MKDPDFFLNQAKQVVIEYFNSKAEKTDGVRLNKNCVYIVWFSKTLQNWKALVSTTISDGQYYEVTYNGDKDEIYLDIYKKLDNVLYSMKSQI